MFGRLQLSGWTKKNREQSELGVLKHEKTNQECANYSFHVLKDDLIGFILQHVDVV